MALLSLFSRRAREARRVGPDVYQYTEISSKLRIQIVQIIQGSVGDYGPYAPGTKWYDAIVDILRRDIGVFELSRNHYNNKNTEFFNWFLNVDDIERAFDGIELFLRALDGPIRQDWYEFRGTSPIDPDAAIAEINDRFKEDGLGYEFVSGEIIRIDSQITHAEIIKPALVLLSHAKYKSAEKEFLAAHSAFRHGDNETCLIECAKAFESVLKVIAKERKWAVKDTDPAKRLLDAAFAANFIESALQAEFTALRSLLESAVPTVRNRMAGHGAGTETRTVPSHIAAFQLHQSAAAMLFLANHHAETP